MMTMARLLGAHILLRLGLCVLRLGCACLSPSRHYLQAPLFLISLHADRTIPSADLATPLWITINRWRAL